MAFISVCIYIFLSYVRLAELVEWMTPLHVLYWLALICLGASVLEWMSSPRRSKASMRETQIWMTCLFFFMAVFSWLRIGWFDEAMFTFSQLQTILGAFIMVVMNLTTLNRIRTMALILVVCCVIMVGQGIAAYHFNWHRDDFVIGDWKGTEEDPNAPPPPDQQASRVQSIGFLNDPNDWAQTLAVGIALTGYFWRKGRFFVNYCILLPANAGMAYGIFLTRSRGGMLSVIALALFAWRERLGKVKATILTTFLVSFMLLFNVTGGRAMRDASSQARIEAWAFGIMLLRQTPLFGIGYNNFTELHGGLTAHNSYVLCFSEMGLTGYFVWMSLLVMSFIQLGRLMKLEGDHPVLQDIRRWASTLRLAMSTFLVAAFFLSRTYILTLYMLIGMIIALEDISMRIGTDYQPAPRKLWMKETFKWMAFSIFLVWLAVKANGAG